MQIAQVREWLDLQEVDDKDERRDYVFYVLKLDDAYRYYMEKKGEIDRKVKEKKEVTQEDLRLSFDDDDSIYHLELEEKRIKLTDEDAYEK